MAMLHSLNNRFYSFFTAYYFMFAVLFGCVKKECICEPIG